jgi:hypothetical protein
MSLNKLVKEELSGSIAKSHVARIASYHRIQASTMFHEAAEYVMNELVKIGLKDVVIEQFLSDGAKKYWTYTLPVGWTVKSAELRQVEPEDKLITSYEDLPQSLHTFSNATPAIGVTAELIDVGEGIKPADYEGKDVKGKLVLATGRARLVHEEAVFKRGAAGVLTDSITYEMPNVRESLDIPDAHAYQAIWPTADELDKVTFGFSLSKRQGEHLRALLKKGKKVKLNARVDAKLFPSKLDVVTATIPGSTKPTEEVFLIAHLCHPKPSANDNASGSGLLMEIARTIRALIDSHKIKPPARTIRFIWVPETYGSIAFLHSHEDLPARLVAGINLDMVGQNQELCRSTLNLDCTPDSLPSFLNDMVYGLMERSVKEFDMPSSFGTSSSTFRYDRAAFSGGSDHAEFTDSTIGVPCVMLLQWPDLFYHTSMDTIDKVSEDSLRRVGWITAVAALTLADAAVEDAFLFANQTASQGMISIKEAGKQAVEELSRKKQDPKLKQNSEELAKELAKTAASYTNRLNHIVWREQEAVKSVKRIGASAELNTFLNAQCEEIRELGKKETRKLEETLDFLAKKSGLTLPILPEMGGELKKLVPMRLFKGTFDFGSLKKALGEKEYKWYQDVSDKDTQFSKKTPEILNFMDGQRNALEIMNSVSAEYNETDPEHVLKFLRDLEKLKLISFK